MRLTYFKNSLLYRNKNFAYLYLGQFISFFGTMITMVAVPYQTYHLTHSNLMVGLVSLGQLLPLLVTALLGGAIADRHHRKRLLLIAETLMALACLILMTNALASKASIVILFIMASFISAINGLHRPALESITQQIVPAKDFAAVGSLRMFLFSIGMIAGPAIGGLLIAHFGLATAYLINVVSFTISLGAITCIKGVAKPENQRDESTLQSLISGVRYAASRQDLLGTYFVDFIAMIFGMPQALFPAIAHAHGGAKTLGLLYAAPAVGSIILSFFTKAAIRIKRQGVAIAIAATLWGIAIIFFGLSKNLWVALFFLALAGAFDAISGVFRSLLWNNTIPNHFRGRLAGIEMISYLSGPKLGDTEAGLVAAAFGMTCSIISGGVLCIIGVAVCCYCLPKFWAYRAPDIE